MAVELIEYSALQFFEGHCSKQEISTKQREGQELFMDTLFCGFLKPKDYTWPVDSDSYKAISGSIRQKWR